MDSSDGQILHLPPNNKRGGSSSMLFIALKYEPIHDSFKLFMRPRKSFTKYTIFERFEDFESQ